MRQLLTTNDAETSAEIPGSIDRGSLSSNSEVTEHTSLDSLVACETSNDTGALTSVVSGPSDQTPSLNSEVAEHIYPGSLSRATGVLETSPSVDYKLPLPTGNKNGTGNNLCHDYTGNLCSSTESIDKRLSCFKCSDLKLKNRRLQKQVSKLKSKNGELKKEDKNVYK